MRITIKYFFLFLAAGLGLGSQFVNGQSISTEDPYNVLFLIADDLRPELNCYGKTAIVSPNIDKLATESMVFTRAYCNVPVCGASRASLFSGTRPTRDKFLGYDTKLDVDFPEAITIAEYFRSKGYYTISNSKVLHHVGDGAGSWNEEWRNKSTTSWRNYQLPENIKMEADPALEGPAWECANVDDTAYVDGKTVIKTIADLKRMKASGKPFFLAAGLLKPHLPFNAPKKYWDLYPAESIKLASNPFKPEGAPSAAMHNSSELRAYSGIPKTGAITDDIALKLRQGYYSCVSYTDAQIGKILKALDDLDLAKNTIVVLIGDHGWNLGEHGLWNKHCNFETSLRSAMMIKVPDITRGTKTNEIVEFVDIFPTLSDLCKLEIPAQCEGMSLKKIIDGADTKSDGIAVSKFYNGVTIINDNYFYTEFINSTSTYARMLYDHEFDRDENKNISEKNENKSLVESLSKLLHKHYTPVADSMGNDTTGIKTSISGTGFNNDVTVYPNPANNILYYHSNVKQVNYIKLIDLMGKIVYSAKAQQQNGSIDLTGIARGLYLVKLHTDNFVITRKISLK